MKKYVIVVCLISITCLAKAQGDSTEKMKSDMGLAFYMGINNSSLSGDDNYSGSVMGIHAGGGIKLVNFSKSWGVRSELLYSQQGGKSTYGSETYGGKSTLRLNYINLGI